jgi:glycosyltransferase involved in cell wall biosynthesis
MPVRNCADTLGAAVRSLLLQSQPEWELLLLEDGSSDGTLALARSFRDARIQVLTDGEFRGIAHRLNQGIEHARGAYIARLDGDDVAFPQRLERQLGFLHEHPKVDLLGTAALMFGTSGRAHGTMSCPAEHDEICRRPWAGFPLWHPSWMGKREWFERYRYLPHASGAEDLNLLPELYSQPLRLPHGDSSRLPSGHSFTQQALELSSPSLPRDALRLRRAGRVWKAATRPGHAICQSGRRPAVDRIAGGEPPDRSA